MRKIIGLIVMIFGLGVFLYPDLCEWKVNKRTDEIISRFEDEYDGSEEYAEFVARKNTDASPQNDLQASSRYEELLSEMECYNESLITDGQRLMDAWSYAQTPVNLDSLESEDGAIGYIRVPSMDVTLPLYIGASEKNMALGAAVMSETSMPIGGTNTNSVIVGHRGYQGAPYFREIEKMEEGDLVYIRNPWSTLTYKVTEIQIIDPYDTESILIRENRDMITLLTCHPYMSHGKYRYVVFCERLHGKDPIPKEAEKQKKDVIIKNPFMVESSEPMIFFEEAVRTLVPILSAGIMFALRKKQKK